MGFLNYTIAKVNELLAKVASLPEEIKDGKTPVLETGTTTTLPAGSDATSEVVANGTDTDGNPKYRLNLGIPKGQAGTGGTGTGGTVDWADVENKPTIPGKISQLENDSGFLASSDLKTINGQSIVGTGNISITGDGTGTGDTTDAGGAQLFVLPSSFLDLTTQSTNDEVLAAVGGDLGALYAALKNNAILAVRSVNYASPLNVYHMLVISSSYIMLHAKYVSGITIEDIKLTLTDTNPRVTSKTTYYLSTKKEYKLSIGFYSLSEDSTHDDILAAFGSVAKFQDLADNLKDYEIFVSEGNSDTAISAPISAIVMNNNDNYACITFSGTGYFLWGGTGGFITIGLDKGTGVFEVSDCVQFTTS